MSRVDAWLAEQGEQAQLDWTKLPAQGNFLQSSAPFLMYSGGFGTGKTYALCAKILAIMTLIPNNLGYLARKDGKALRQTTVLVLLELLPKNWIASHNQQAGTLRLTPEMGGSMLIYGDLKDKNDLKNHNLGFFAIDQAEEIEEADWDFLTGRLRRKIAKPHPEGWGHQFDVVGECPMSGEKHLAIGEAAKTCLLCEEALPKFRDTLEGDERDPPWDLITYPRFGFAVCNTEDPHHWIYRTFGGLPGPANDVSVGMPGYQAYSATTYDGLRAGYTDREYVEALEQKYAQNRLMFERYVLGKWVVAEGLVFPAFSKEHHVFHPEAIKHDGSPLIPEGLGMFEYIDPGTTSTTAVGWVVVQRCECGCGKVNYFVIGEHYVASAHPEYHASQIKFFRQELKRPVTGTYMDAQAFSRNQVARVTESTMSQIYSIAQLYQEYGIYATRNQKKWDVGYMRLTEALADDPTHLHPVTGQLGAPHWLVSSDCPHWIEEVVNYKWKARKGGIGKEEPIDRDDHHMDGSVGFIAGRPEYRVDAPAYDTVGAPHVPTLEEEIERFTAAPSFNYLLM